MFILRRPAALNFRRNETERRRSRKGKRNEMEEEVANNRACLLPISALGMVSSVNCPDDEIERFYPVHSCKLRQTMEPSVVLGSSSHQRLSGVGLWTAGQPFSQQARAANQPGVSW